LAIFDPLRICFRATCERAGNPISVAILNNVVKDTISDALTESGQPLGSRPAKHWVTTRGGREVDARRTLERETGNFRAASERNEVERERLRE
jgi:hypothetical protein